MIGDARKMGMTKGSEQAGFALELSCGSFGDELVFFDRAVDVEVSIYGIIYCAHAALPKQTMNQIAVLKELTDCKCHDISHSLGRMIRL